MKSKFSAAILAICIAANASSQSPTKQWDATFGGSERDQLNSMQKTYDGGYILGGYSESPAGGDKSQDDWGGGDYWIVKTNPSGSKQWDKRFGGTGTDWLSSVIQTTDSGYLLTGSSNSPKSGDKTLGIRGGHDYWIIKTNANEVKQWESRFGGEGWDLYPIAIRTNDGGFLIAGSSASGAGGDKSGPNKGGYDYWIIKTDAGGVKQWDVTLGGSSDDMLSAVIQTTDGGYLLGGESTSPASGDKTQDKWGTCQGCPDYWIVKTDAHGVKQWDRRFGGTNSDNLTSIVETLDGYLLAGYSYSVKDGDKSEIGHGVSDYWIVKTDTSGNKEWDHTYGGESTETLGQVYQTDNGDFVLAGSSASNTTGTKSQQACGNSDFWVVRTDENGQQLWDVDFGGHDLDMCSAFAIADDGGVVMGGYSESDSSCDKSEDDRDACDNCFPNGDYWIIKTFPDLSSCSAPTSGFSASTKSTSAKLSWEAVNTAQTYSVRYRKTGTVPWTKTTAITNSKKLAGLLPNTQYDWSVKSVCNPLNNISSDWSPTQNFTTKPLKLENENDDEEISLKVFPNPVSSGATISFSLTKDSPVVIELFSVDGKKVTTIAEGNFSEGEHDISFRTERLSSGGYLLRFEASHSSIVRKMIVEE